jgi:uncharacterized protein (DUF427 family)
MPLLRWEGRFYAGAGELRVKATSTITTAVWTYEAPYAPVSAIREFLAVYPDRVDAIEVGIKD